MKYIKKFILSLSLVSLLLCNTIFALSHRDWNGDPNITYIEINNNMPTFHSNYLNREKGFYEIGSRDNLGRETACIMCAGPETLPTEEREPSLSSVTPSGWKYNGKSNNNKYPGVVSGNYVYNRCHLLGFQYSHLGSETPNNLITGTRWFNVISMLPFENDIRSYIKKTKNHVLVKACPIYEGNNLVAEGITFEGYSIEDNGDGVCFNVFCPNIQPGIEINYATGQNSLSESNTDTSYTDPFYKETTKETIKETTSAVKETTNNSYNEDQDSYLQIFDSDSDKTKMIYIAIGCIILVILLAKGKKTSKKKKR